MDLNLPKFRAKRLDNGEYVEGYLTRSRCYSGLYILPVDFNNDDNISGYEEEIIEIDPTTLSINFPNMLDMEDTPIFASLNPSGKGADFDNTYSYNETVFIFESQETIPYFQNWSDFKVAGIKE